MLPPVPPTCWDHAISARSFYVVGELNFADAQLGRWLADASATTDCSVVDSDRPTSMEILDHHYPRRLNPVIWDQYGVLYHLLRTIRPMKFLKLSAGHQIWWLTGIFFHLCWPMSCSTSPSCVLQKKIAHGADIALDCLIWMDFGRHWTDG